MMTIRLILRGKARVGQGWLRKATMAAGVLAMTAMTLATLSVSRAQNPEMEEGACRNLTSLSEEMNWRDLSNEIPVLIGDYDNPQRPMAPDWRLEPICDGRFMWAIALFGDVAPFALKPTDDMAVFEDFNGNRWIFTLEADGSSVTGLTCELNTGKSIALTPMHE